MGKDEIPNAKSPFLIKRIRGIRGTLEIRISLNPPLSKGDLREIPLFAKLVPNSASGGG